jgi:hypothetical protein
MTWCTYCSSLLHGAGNFCGDCGRPTSARPTPAQNHAPSGSSLSDRLDELAKRTSAAPSPLPLPIVPGPPARRTDSPTRRPISRYLLGLAIVAVVALSGLAFDESRRSVETRILLVLIEDSEAIMLGFQDTVAATLTPFENREPSESEALRVAEVLSNAAGIAQQDLEAAAGKFDGSNLQIWSWHQDVVTSRNRYLEHHAAWVAYLGAVRADFSEIFEEQPALTSTFIDACSALRDLTASDVDLTKRVETVCAESDEAAAA